MKKNEKAKLLVNYLQIHSFRRREQVRKIIKNISVLLVPFGTCRGIEYMCLHLSRGKYLENVKESERAFISEFVDSFARVENVEQYLSEGEDLEEMDEKLYKFVNNSRMLNLAEVRLNLLDFYLDKRLDLLWRSLKKFNHQKKRRGIIFYLSQIKNLLKQSSFLMKLIEKKLEIVFGIENFNIFERVTNLVEHFNSGFVNQGLSEIYKSDWLNVDYNMTFKLSFIQYESYREAIHDFFKNIIWSEQVSLHSFQKFIFERQVDSPLKTFFLLHTISVGEENPNHLFDPLVESIETKGFKQEEIRRILSTEPVEFYEQEPIQEYFRKLFKESTLPARSDSNTKQPFTNLFSLNNNQEEEKIFSSDLIKTCIEECLTQHQLIELLDTIYPFTDQNYHMYYKPEIENHLRDEILIEPLLRKQIFKEEVEYISKYCSDLCEMCQTICTQFENLLSTL